MNPQTKSEAQNRDLGTEIWSFTRFLKQQVLEKADRSLWILGTLLHSIQLFYIVNYAVNVPVADEWEALRPGNLERTLNWSWLFQLHNEHRIVPTKILTWILLRVSDLNIVSQIYFNYFVFLVLAILVVRGFTRYFQVPGGFLFCLLSASLLHENHMWAFQSQFHFFLLFFVSSLLCLSKSNAMRYFGPLFAAASVFSFGSGVVCAVFVVFYCAFQSIRVRKEKVFYLSSCAFIILAIAQWSWGFHKNPGHPDLAFPWTFSFWQHYLNALSLGFGFTELSILPGAVLLVLLVVAGLYLFSLEFKASPFSHAPERNRYLSLFVFLLGIGGAVAAVSMARAGFGQGQAKSSRYAEISIMLLIPLWVASWKYFSTSPIRKLFHQKVFPNFNAQAQNVVFALVMGALFLAPYSHSFQWKKIFRLYLMAGERVCIA